eukprot:GEMP01102691.1.p2 GENE.GEMP01102691.1~~GEMP01102691.1.p2  ORF type:complete len:100 (-),score=21.06 GEMP01102691.1:240-539(-)
MSRCSISCTGQYPLFLAFFYVECPAATAASICLFAWSRALPQSSSALDGLGLLKSGLVSLHGGSDSSQLLTSGATATLEAQQASELSFVFSPKAALQVG